MFFGEFYFLRSSIPSFGDSAFLFLAVVSASGNPVTSFPLGEFSPQVRATALSTDKIATTNRINLFMVPSTGLGSRPLAR